MTEVAVVQFKPRKGDVDGNLAQVRDVFAQFSAVETPPALVVFPEAALTAYFLEGAVYELAMSADALTARLDALWRETGRGTIDVVLGFYENDGGTYHNSALYATLGETPGGRVVHVHRKMFLPTYGVFDEERFLTRGRRLGVFASAFGRAAILICEDAWHGVTATVAALKGARLLIVPSASPGRGLGGPELESNARWRAVLGNYASEHGVYVVYAGLVGFEGGKGMSGSSCIVGPRGDVLVGADALTPCVLTASLDTEEVDLARAALPLLGDLGAVLPDLWLDDELPLPRRAAETAR